ncbi:protein misato homolog 1-like [Anneissia japonica]|uniref:protein misato homolog 1-like n=1 Tax=Anneissia japonica TaxID=1529436 RepID=UPI0014255AB6|nr:protein misato homolog 1-like [Anneissia japonica]
MGPRELITIQCGHFSNFVGTHFWNIQESTFCYDINQASSRVKEIDHDVLYREGKTIMNEVTYTPRLIAIDLKGSLKTLSVEGILYDCNTVEESADVRWAGDVTLHKAGSLPKNQFLIDLEKQDELFGGTTSNEEDNSSQEADTTEMDEDKMNEELMELGIEEKVYDLDDSVEVWSDFLRCHLHPKSVAVIKEYTHESELEPFEIFSQGMNLWKDGKVSDQMEDRLHFYTEECDHLQGFQVLVDFYNGFSGFGSGLLESLSDEYGSKGIITVGVSPSQFPEGIPKHDSQHTINAALAFQNLAESSSLFTPVSLAETLWRKPGPPINFQNLVYKPNLNYHTSAILASVLDTATLSLRLEGASYPLYQLTDALSTMGRKVATLNASFPFAMTQDQALSSVFCNHGDRPFWKCLTPHSNQNLAPFVQSVLLRGVSERKLNIRNNGIPKTSLDACSTTEDMLQMYLMGAYSRTRNSGKVVTEPSKVATPYPRIFPPTLDKDGFTFSPGQEKPEVTRSVPMVTSIQSTPGLQTTLETLHKEAKKLDIKKFNTYEQYGLESDDYNESLEKLIDLCRCYSTQSFNSDSSSDED